MRHPAFKTQLFRFVDVFPACRDDEDVLRHLEEYFDGPERVEVPRALDLGIDVAEHVPFGAHVSASVARRNSRRMARQFIAGADPAAALVKLALLWRRGEASTVDLLGEKAVIAAETEGTADTTPARQGFRVVFLPRILHPPPPSGLEKTSGRTSIVEGENGFGGSRNAAAERPV